MKINLILPALIAGLIITTAANAAVYARDVSDIADNVVRLHVVANSDSEDDQRVKLKVRDVVISYVDSCGLNHYDRDEFVELMTHNLSDIERVANEVLLQNGSKDTAYAQITKVSFPARIYDGVTLPAGEYTALRIVIGEGAGQNWWCVMFPPLCSNAVPDEECVKYLRDNIGEGAFMMITSPDGNVKYELRLKTADIIYEIKSRIK